jgi:hypothetical protein
MPYEDIDWKRIWGDLRINLNKNEEMKELKPGKEEMNLRETIEYLINEGIVDESNKNSIRQIVDSMNKVIALLLPKPYDICLPVKPSQVMFGMSIIVNKEDISLGNYEKTLEILNKLIKKKLPYTIEYQIVLKEKIIGFIFDTNRIILIEPIHEDSKKVVRNIKKYAIKYDPEELENSIEKNEIMKDERVEEINKWYF